MKASTRVGTLPPELEAHLGDDTSSGVSDETVHGSGVPFEPVRLLAGGGSAFEQRLLGSTRDDHMPATSRQQLARALNVPSAAAPAGPLRALLRSLRFGKHGPIVGVGALALLAAWGVQRRPTTPVEPMRQSGAWVKPAATEAGQGVELAPRSAEVEAAVGAAVMPDELADVAAPSPAVEPVSSGSKQRVRAPRPLQATASRAGLREELRALEAVQSALRAGHSNEARGRLEEYARRFPEGELRLEAELLGLDVSLARGERKQTRERARQLLARPEAARYRERLEALLSAAGTDAPATAVGSESSRSSHRKSGDTE
jgi:hypothetical protein